MQRLRQGRGDRDGYLLSSVCFWLAPFIRTSPPARVSVSESSGEAVLAFLSAASPGAAWLADLMRTSPPARGVAASSFSFAFIWVLLFGKLYRHFPPKMLYSTQMLSREKHYISVSE